MNTVSLLVLNILSLSGLAVSQQSTNDTCCLPPVSLFALASDLRDNDIFPGFTANYFLITAGEVDQILLLPGIGQELYLATGIVDFPLLLISTEEDVLFNFTIRSDNTQVLLNPELLPNAHGTVPVTPQRSHVIFQCISTSDVAIQVNVELESYSQLSQRQFCPVTFSFGKDCQQETSISSGDLEDFSMVDPVNEQVDIPSYGGCNDTTDATPTTKQDQKTFVTVILSTVIPITTVILTCLMVAVAIWSVWYYTLKVKTKELELAAIGKAYLDTHEAWISMNQEGGHKKEFPIGRLKIQRELGEGAFGIVYEGLAEGIEEEGEETQVAVKQLRDMSAVDEFFREVEFMSDLDHPQIVRLLGVCSLQEPYAMIFEYMDLGDLCSFLREAAILQTEGGGESVLEPLDLLRMGLQVAEGMVFIAQRKLVHRDLATRNCLVQTGLTVKIGDFGMSRNIYSTDYYRVQGSALLPVRWMAPESIKYGKFSESSDIWSYGILLWEVFSYGQQPYAGYTNDEVIAFVGSGQYLTPPTTAGSAAQVMFDCWERKPKNRPTFTEVTTHLTTLINEMERGGHDRTESHL